MSISINSFEKKILDDMENGEDIEVCYESQQINSLNNSLNKFRSPDFKQLKTIEKRKTKQRYQNAQSE